MRRQASLTCRRVASGAGSPGQSALAKQAIDGGGRWSDPFLALFCFDDSGQNSEDCRSLCYPFDTRGGCLV